ncbi:MAG: heme ABC exporter ATP-binding protein CcmA [Myxococcaceae bacterium]|nr:heme ABC exporter ATP-binding protein CcmA [Myxococcaceae bacterium]MCA3014594.1 heme ABC exporter ATP-binding protein CcmA [Myxococcaceae bacterium]
MALALEALDVSKRFGARWALARLSFSLPEGRSLLLTGHNGSGKTTLLRLIATASFPTAGVLKVLGYDSRAQRDALRPLVALVSHASFHYEDLTAAQNLSLTARLLGVAKPSTVVDELLGRLGLRERADSPVRQFSAGMRKRLAIARLLLRAPKVALLDEPFGELDPAGIAQMEALIAELQAQGASVVLATHLVEQGQRLTHERLHLEGGRKAAAA